MHKHSYRPRAESCAIATELWVCGCSDQEIADLMNWTLRYVKMLLSYFRRTRDWQLIVYEKHTITIPSKEWLDTFKGFFYGEGTVQFYLREAGRKLPTPGLSLTLREDDKAILDNIRSVLGGNMVYVPHPSTGNSDYTANPQWRWSVVGWHKMKTILEVTRLHESPLPAKKVEEARLLYEAIQLRFSMPLKLTAEMRERLAVYSERIHEVKRFSC